MSYCDEDATVYNGHFEIEILIARPVAQVWRQFLDLPAWVTSHRIENASGTPHAVGSITRVTDKTAQELGYAPPYYHYCKIMKLIPERQYVLKTYSEKGGSYGMQMTCFDDSRFTAIDGKTKITFNLFAEIRGDFVAKDPAAMNLDDSLVGMTSNLNNLKRIAESR